jgi:hypothetical protein
MPDDPIVLRAVLPTVHPVKITAGEYVIADLRGNRTLIIREAPGNPGALLELLDSGVLETVNVPRRDAVSSLSPHLPSPESDQESVRVIPFRA